MMFVISPMFNKVQLSILNSLYLFLTAGGVVHKIPVTIASSEEDSVIKNMNTVKNRKRANKRSSWSTFFNSCLFAEFCVFTHPTDACYYSVLTLNNIKLYP